jgi:insertion element IS1 protein InsB
VNERLLQTLDPLHVDVILRQVEKAELDEMWSFVGSKSQQRWLWHAIDHYTGEILAYVFGPREDGTFLQLKALLAPFGITRFYTDGWGAYRRHLDLGCLKVPSRAQFSCPGFGPREPSALNILAN